jgi:uncharacterized damage-inducible protein DinB
MTESLRLWARYNLSTDEKVNALLDQLDASEYSKERNTYYNSLAGLHLHIVQTYKFYQGLIRTNSNGKYLVSPLTEPDYEVRPAPLPEVSRLALEYDRLFAEFADQVTKGDLAGPKVPRTMRSGKTYLLSLGDIAAQYWNHAVHHRGQLSQLLDELGVEHDIGGLLTYAEEQKS